MFRFLSVIMLSLSITTMALFGQTKNLLMLVLAIVSVLLCIVCLMETKKEKESLKTKEVKEQISSHFDVKI